jgi:hypothetical protein
MTPKNYLPAEHAEKRRNESKDDALLIFQREVFHNIFVCRIGYSRRKEKEFSSPFLRHLRILRAIKIAL